MSSYQDLDIYKISLELFYEINTVHPYFYLNMRCMNLQARLDAPPIL
jgi:hypothetical protein